MGCCSDGWDGSQNRSLVSWFLRFLGALGGWFLVIEPPRRQGRQGDVLASSITENSKNSKKFLKNAKELQGQ